MKNLKCIQGCFLCGKNKTIKIWKETFELTECLSCGFLWVNPYPQDSAEKEYLAFSKFVEKYPFNKPHPRIHIFEDILKKIQSFKKEGKLLDIGCHGGFFLEIAKEKNYEVCGVEINPVAIEYAQKRFGFKIERSVENLDEKFDIICLLDVIEHIVEPKNFLMKISHSLLLPDGIIVLKTPNADYIKLKIMLKKFLKLKSDLYLTWGGHLQYFNRNTLEILLKFCGLKIISFSFMPYYKSCEKYYWQHRLLQCILPSWLSCRDMLIIATK